MLKLATKFRVYIIIIISIIFHIMLKIVSVFIAGMLIGTSDASSNYVIYFELFFVLVHMILVFEIYRKNWLIQSKKELVFIVLFTVFIIVGLYYYNYLPKFGSG